MDQHDSKHHQHNDGRMDEKPGPNQEPPQRHKDQDSIHSHNPPSAHGSLQPSQLSTDNQAANQRLHQSEGQLEADSRANDHGTHYPAHHGETQGQDSSPAINNGHVHHMDNQTSSPQDGSPLIHEGAMLNMDEPIHADHQTPHHMDQVHSHMPVNHTEHQGGGIPALPSYHSGHHIHDEHEHEHSGGEHSHHDPNIFKRKFWISVLLTIPVLAFSMHFLGLLGLSSPHWAGGHYVTAVFATLVFFYGGIVFLQGWMGEMEQRQPGMMTLIGLAITVSYGYSLLVTLGLPGEEIYWELATLIDIMLLGHWLEMGAVQNAGSALDEMAKLLPDSAVRVEGEQLNEIAVNEILSGDTLLIRPGARVPADGVVVMGESLVNQAMITGESVPVNKQIGDMVIAGTINAEGALRIQVTKTGGATYLAGIMRLVQEAQKSRSRSQVLADRAAFWLVIIAVSSAIVTALVWSAAGVSSATVMERVVTVMVAACPHALGLAIPLVIAISTTLSARSGLLVRNRLMFEDARSINYVVFDKTGTLTKGEHTLTNIIPAEGISSDEVLRLAAAAEFEAEHLLGRAVVKAAREKNILITSASGFESMPGKGVTANIEGQRVQVGGPNLAFQLGANIPHSLAEANRSQLQAGHTVVYLFINNEIKGLLNLADTIKEESAEAIKEIKSMGIKVAMLTGDNEAVADRISNQLGIDEYFAGVLPENKAAKVKSLQAKGYRVAMVGDGVNDAPALAQADVGIAIGAGTDVAVESAGIILVKSDPRDVARLFILSRATYRKMVQNLAWATAYNILVIPLAAGVLAPWGFILPMAAGAVVMSLSTIIVAVNAQFLKNVQTAW